MLAECQSVLRESIACTRRTHHGKLELGTPLKGREPKKPSLVSVCNNSELTQLQKVYLRRN